MILLNNVKNKHNNKIVTQPYLDLPLFAYRKRKREVAEGIKGD
jgi:hypothetical protein